MKPSKLHADVYAGIVLILFGIFFYVQSNRLPNGAALWPKIILLLLIMLSTLLVISGIKKTTQAAESDNEPPQATRKWIVKPMLSFAMMVLYVIVMDLTGFFVSTAIFLPLGMYFMKQRSLVLMLSVTAGLEIFVYFLFVMQLKLRMP